MGGSIHDGIHDDGKSKNSADSLSLTLRCSYCEHLDHSPIAFETTKISEYQSMRGYWDHYVTRDLELELVQVQVVTMLTRPSENPVYPTSVHRGGVEKGSGVITYHVPFYCTWLKCPIRLWNAIN